MATKKKGIGICIAAIVVISVFAFAVTPTSAWDPYTGPKEPPALPSSHDTVIAPTQSAIPYGTNTGQYKITSSSATTATFTFHIPANDVIYISFPVLPPEGHRSPVEIFGTDVVFWAYNPTTDLWYGPSEVEAGKGYYLKSTSGAKDVTVTGQTVKLTWDDIKTSLVGNGAWNLIGPGKDPIKIISFPEGDEIEGWDVETQSWFYVWPGSGILTPGKGYWVFVTSEPGGEGLVLPSAVPTLTPIGLVTLVSLLSAITTITITRRKRR